MHNISLIIPVYNRPQEINELLESIEQQTLKPFEIIIIEDGSQLDSEIVINNYLQTLPITYIKQANTGPGPARNLGASLAKGDYLIFLDSDVILPRDYIFNVLDEIKANPCDCFGGPDMAHESFNTVQKAISYSMTSTITTGGIRGGNIKMDKFYPRSFNMGIKKGVFNVVNGFSHMRFGEDLDLSMRVLETGFTTSLYSKIAVYHKRRNTFKSFFKQVYNSGIARINLYKKHPSTLKTVHFLPAAYTIGIMLLSLLSLLYPLCLIIIVTPSLILFIDAFTKTKELTTSLLSVIAANVQLIGYGTGFIKAFFNRLILQKKEFYEFKESFYK